MSGPGAVAGGPGAAAAAVRAPVTAAVAVPAAGAARPSPSSPTSLSTAMAGLSISTEEQFVSDMGTALEKVVAAWTAHLGSKEQPKIAFDKAKAETLCRQNPVLGVIFSHLKLHAAHVVASTTHGIINQEVMERTPLFNAISMYQAGIIAKKHEKTPPALIQGKLEALTKIINE